jgi:hypothetical protein
MRAGAAHVLAADIDRLALAAIRLNAAANGATIDTMPDDLLDTSRAKSDSFEVILVGDLFYERALAERVFAFIETARRLHRDCTHRRRGDPRRRSAPQLLPHRPLPPGRRVPCSRHARAGGRRDQAHRRLAARRRRVTVTDEWTKEGLAIEVDGRIRSLRVIEVLLRLVSERGAALYLRSDNGPEFVSRALLSWITSVRRARRLQVALEADGGVDGEGTSRLRAKGGWRDCPPALWRHPRPV